MIRADGTWIDSRFSWLRVMLRLKPDQSLDEATAILRGVQPQIREATLPPDAPPRIQETFLKEPFTLVSASSASRLRYRYERSLLTVFAAVILVLLVACANIANLLLARGAARRYDLSVRLALGAPRWRLTRQLFAESLVLAAAAAALGLAIAVGSSRFLVTQLSSHLERVFLDVSLDWRVMLFSLGVTVGTAMLFGVLPAFRASRVAPLEALTAHGRPPSRHGRFGAAGESTLLSGVVVGQLALSLVLIAAAGLFVGTFNTLATRSLGFDRNRVLLVRADASRLSIDGQNAGPFYQSVIDAITQVPGVAGAAISMLTPVSGLRMTGIVETAESAGLSELERTVHMNYVTPGWFGSYGIAIREGRDLEARDTKDAPAVVVVNEAFARRLFPAGNPVNATITDVFAAQSGQAAAQRTVVGVVGDTAYRTVRDDMQPTMYVPLDQLNGWAANFDVSVRSSGSSPAGLQNAISQALKSAAPDLMFTFIPLADQLGASFMQERLVAILSSFFGLLALLLAALGLYGVTAYSVARRRREIGIRMALGCAPADVIRLVLSRVSLLVAIGVLVGGGISFWASRFVAPLLYGLEPRDVSTLAAAAAILAAVATMAAFIPAWSASRIDPAVVLRSE